MGISFSEHNKRFYDASDQKWLRQLAESKGLTGNRDLEAIRKTLTERLPQENGSILEIGVGFGRVGEWLTTHYPHIDYTGLDFSVPGVEHCRRSLQANDHRRFILDDILNFSENNRFDVALWPWSGLFELSNDDKPKALRNIFKALRPDGVLMMDFPKQVTGREKLVYKDRGIVEQHSEFGYVRNQLLSTEELDQLLGREGFVPVDEIRYVSDSGYERFVKIVRKGA